jgi:hypothetical protein
MLVAYYARQYGVSNRTILRWRKKGYPLDDAAKMTEIRERGRSRSGVGKFTPRISESATIAPVRTVVAEIIPVEATLASPEPYDDNESTLQRLEQAERVAYKRYLDSGGSERASIAWLGICDQKRKLIADQAKQTSDVSDAETKFFHTCGEVIHNLHLHLETAPKLLGLLCEGLERDAIAEKIADQLRRTVGHAVVELADAIRETSLEILLPPHERGRRTVRPDEMAD